MAVFVLSITEMSDSSMRHIQRGNVAGIYGLRRLQIKRCGRLGSYTFFHMEPVSEKSMEG